MRINKQKVSKRPEVRCLKIQTKFRSNKYLAKPVPEIKLCGNWLEKLGFKDGQHVTIATMPQLLIIRLVE
jgi:hypothetical protein